MLDYADGKLEEPRLAAVKAHLQSHAEDAQLLADMKLAGAALRDWDAQLPARASENFWPQLREQLPPQPGRSLLRQMGFKGLALPSLRLSLGAAIAAAVIAMIVFMSAPQQSVNPTSASDLTPADQAFVTQSLQRHEAYAAGQPMNGTLSIPVTPGNTQSIETGEDASEEYIP
jgi:anti-sigma factor RsiW